jgi:hypothetical protein
MLLNLVYFCHLIVEQLLVLHLYEFLGHCFYNCLCIYNIAILYFSHISSCFLVIFRCFSTYRIHCSFVWRITLYFECIYLQPHPISNCLVLYVKGLLYYENPKDVWNTPRNPYGNIVCHIGMKKLFTMLLKQFHVELRSSMPTKKLTLLLQYILPKLVYEIMSFIFSREVCQVYKEHPCSYKILPTLFLRSSFKGVCIKDHVLFVDVQPLS